ncbi:glycosyltransferase family 2 protein [Salinibacterium sp.]|uniref:glycosyltransferase family 2 protein n=1 Tax=Salinibacterium sp. TaxID=1915057 RepID=UPI00286C619B|nr:glycosyltransferase family 2 protein [Salinibacterium sp.]
MRISVALATYNGAQFIEEQVASILRGSRVPEEVVLADDGSTDNTVELVRAAFGGSRTSAQLHVLPAQVRLGVTANFERAVSACTGDIIVLSDQDDVWHEYRLAVAERSFEARPRLLLQHSDARLVDSAGKPLGVSLIDALTVRAGERLALDSGRAFQAYVRRNLATGATVAMRRKLIDLAAPFPPEWVHDEWLAIIAAALGEVEFVDSELIDYRQHDSNQIGVAKPTLSYRVGRMLEPRGERFVLLSARSQILVDRLAALPVAPGVLKLAEQKASFEARRAAMPDQRVRRLGAIVREVVRGSYGRLSSQGIIDVARDLIQPV